MKLITFKVSVPMPPFAMTWNFRRRSEAGANELGSLHEWLGLDPGSAPRVLMLAPHDDDGPLGMGLLVQALAQIKASLKALVVSDGRMGYCTLAEKAQITEIREEEACAAYELLGIYRADLQFGAYPDGSLARHLGRDPSRSLPGLEDLITKTLREVRPDLVFCPTSADLHLDHRAVYHSLRISLFHACGEIWPELGAPLGKLPRLFETAVYCRFKEPPTHRLAAPAAAFETKLRAIRCFKSQRQIAALAAAVEAGGAIELLREVKWQPYAAADYDELFLERG
jgi:LmbE family N-acetylglucosaminyl deacetylase